ncbi:MAG: SLBB domain-containing protein [Candidatus Neomarinimicrobiota bacterium]
MFRKVGQMLIGVAVMASMVVGQTRLFDDRDQAETRPEEKIVPPYQIPVKGTALEHTIVPAEYMVGPGDRFIVSILSSEPYLELVTVAPTGIIVLPGIGAVAAADLTAEDASKRVLAVIKEFYPAYEASCVLYGIREIRVSVSGAVKSPGFHEVTPLSRLTDLLNLAGGIQPNAALHRIQLVRRSEGNQVLDLASYYHDGDLSQNPYLKEGDQVIVPYGDVKGDLVSVRGLAVNPAYYAVKPNETVAYFIKRISTGTQADLTNITLQRLQGHESSVLQVISADQFSTFTLQPGDVVYIDCIASVSVIGEVRKPGQYAFQPGLKAEEYIVLAGGANRDGSLRQMEVIRANDQTLQGKATEVQEGDTIYVPRSFSSVFLGQLGMIQAALTFLNIYLAYLAASAR